VKVNLLESYLDNNRFEVLRQRGSEFLDPLLKIDEAAVQRITCSA
jgi:hypothetical protein